MIWAIEAIVRAALRPCQQNRLEMNSRLASSTADSTELYPDGSPNNADASARCSYAREAVYGFKEMKETEAPDVDE